MYFHYFVIISPWKKAGLSFIHLWLKKKSWIYFTQECFVTSLAKIVPVVLENKIFKFHLYIFTLSLFSPFWIGFGPVFEHTWIYFMLGCFVQSLAEIGRVVLEKID